MFKRSLKKRVIFQEIRTALRALSHECFHVLGATPLNNDGPFLTDIKTFFNIDMNLIERVWVNRNPLIVYIHRESTYTYMKFHNDNIELHMNSY